MGIDPAFLAWRTIRATGAWTYQENTKTGERRAVRIFGSGYQPVDKAWLQGGAVIA